MNKIGDIPKPESEVTEKVIQDVNCGDQDTCVESNLDVPVKDTSVISETVLKDDDYVKPPPPPTEEIIFATVTFDLCKKSKLDRQDLKGIEGLLTRFDHLKQNIVNIDFGNYSTSRSENSFCHRLDVKLLVDVSRLWEHARPYIWKFFGQQEWKLSDGTLITFSRIHAKL